MSPREKGQRLRREIGSETHRERRDLEKGHRLRGAGTRGSRTLRDREGKGTPGDTGTGAGVGWEAIRTGRTPATEGGGPGTEPPARSALTRPLRSRRRHLPPQLPPQPLAPPQPPAPAHCIQRLGPPGGGACPLGGRPLSPGPAPNSRF